MPPMAFVLSHIRNRRGQHALPRRQADFVDVEDGRMRICRERPAPIRRRETRPRDRHERGRRRKERIKPVLNGAVRDREVGFPAARFAARISDRPSVTKSASGLTRPGAAAFVTLAAPNKEGPTHSSRILTVRIPRRAGTLRPRPSPFERLPMTTFNVSRGRVRLDKYPGVELSTKNSTLKLTPIEFSAGTTGGLSPKVIV